MAVTKLDRTSALILVDLQAGIVALPGLPPLANVIGAARALADAFRARGLPVVLVNVDAIPPGRTERPARVTGPFPAAWCNILPELDPQPADIRVTKRSAGTFSTTDLAARLRAHSVTQVVIGGISTSGGVEATARQAYELGFHVALASDAMADPDAAAAEWSLGHVFPRIGETGTARAIIALLPDGSA